MASYQDKTPFTDQEHSMEAKIVVLTKNDIPRAKKLCQECFPISYPDSWYEKAFPLSELSSKTNRRSYGITAPSGHGTDLLAILVAEIQELKLAESEGIYLDYSTCTKARPKALYLSILGVTTSCRGRGYGSMILNHMFDAISESNIKVVYLHVLGSNTTALSFYFKHGFHVHSEIPNYYELTDGHHDGILCVKYVNGGKPGKLLLHRAWQSGCGCLSSIHGLLTWFWDSTTNNVFQYYTHKHVLTVRPKPVNHRDLFS